MGIYEKHYKKLLLIPFIILLLAIGQIGYQYATTGDFISKSVRLKGGTTVYTEETLNSASMESFLTSEFHGQYFKVGKSEGGSGSVIESDLTEDRVQDLKDAIESKDVTITGAITEDPEFSANFYRTMLIVILVAFILMGIVVFVSFRTPVPSLAVILSAFSDIIVTLAIFNMLDFQLLKGGLAAFLMLIGYSVDTDILLTNRVLKRKIGTVYERIKGAMSTGLKMSITTIGAVAVAYIFAIPPDIKQIMVILLIGLIVDLMNTWIQNTGILRWYMEKRKHE
ncbi:protein translocase subunit SecF [Candidatus Woesearchaeota archaeon]|nr:protein translocase subunit SecF [Candidatus Woesearchaeota archaeon]